ncbi:hypothetical protein Tco_0625018 [Tanacetum coccineum]|uniref:Uncharacterized protein n=1 Tax=Tanacetum coccineum TaxID=301880 RepID=A0ABQ4WFL7_9ASTR
MWDWDGIGVRCDDVFDDDDWHREVDDDITSDDDEVGARSGLPEGVGEAATWEAVWYRGLGRRKPRTPTPPKPKPVCEDHCLNAAEKVRRKVLPTAQQDGSLNNPNQASLHQMANLDFCDTHNMVAFLNKSEGSEGFQQIVDFLNTSHIKFALTENPTIYTSLIQQFWQTASTSTLEDGEVEITATIDGQLKTITEASLRRHLKLEDADGISSLPNTEIFEQLALMGYASDSNKLTFQKGHGEGSTVPVESHHIPITTLSTSQPPLSSSSRVPTPLYDSPLPGGHTPRSDEGRMQHTELMDLVIKLSDKVLALETDLQHTKKVFSTTVTKLIMKVKILEKIVKSSKARRRARIIVSDDEKVLEDSSKQGRMIDDIDQDAGITLVTPTKTSTQEDHLEDQLGFLSSAKVLTDVARVHTYSRRRTVSLGSGRVSNASRIISTAEEIVSTAGASMSVSTVGRQRIAKVHQAVQGFTEDEWENISARVEAEREKYSEVDQQRAKAKRNKPMTQAQQKTYMSNYIKNQEGGYSIKQLKSLSFEEVKEIFETTMRKIRKASGSEQSAEKEKEVSEEELQKLLVIVPVEEVYIQALQVKYPIIDWDIFTEESRSYWRIIRVGNHTEVYQILEDMLKRFNRDDLEKL